MLIRFPKDDKYFSWTRHIKNKMIFYGLSEQKIRTVLNSPKRKEEGIAPNTTAVMKRNDRGKKKEEIWVMYQSRTNADKFQSRIHADKNVKEHVPRKSALISLRKSARMLMISAWRYPGISKPGSAIPIPDEILTELGGDFKSKFDSHLII